MTTGTSSTASRLLRRSARRGQTGDAPQPSAGGGPAARGNPVTRATMRALRHESKYIGLVAVALFIGAWQLVAEVGVVSDLLLPAPTGVADGLVTMFSSPTIMLDLATSGREFATGYLLAVFVGVPAGIAMGWYPAIRSALQPFVNFFYSTPRIALIPLLIIWFGIGIWSKVAVIYLGAIFPIVITTMTGIQNLDPALLRAARSFGASDWQVFRTLGMPGSVPFVLAGLRLGIGHALVGVVVGELIAAQHGIGLILTTAGNTFQTRVVFAAILVIATTGMVLTYALLALERRFQSWKPTNS